MDSMPLGRTTSKATVEGPLSSKWQEVLPWYKVLKQSCSEAFSCDTSLVKEARKENFKWHSYNFTMEGTCDLSEAFRHMAESAKLLGSSIYEIQEVWKGPDKLWQANYALRSLPKGFKFLHVVPHQSSQRLWDWWAYMTWMPFATSTVWPTAPGVGRMVRTREQLLTTCGQCTTGLVWCATNVTTTHQPHQTLSAAMAGRTVHPQERETPMSQFCQSNYQQETGRINLSKLGI